MRNYIIVLFFCDLLATFCQTAYRLQSVRSKGVQSWPIQAVAAERKPYLESIRESGKAQQLLARNGIRSNNANLPLVKMEEVVEGSSKVLRYL